MVYIWFVYELHMKHIWFIYGFNMNYIWTQYEILSNRYINKGHNQLSQNKYLLYQPFHPQTKQ